jgi:predicted RNA-binding protein with PIN domain
MENYPSNVILAINGFESANNTLIKRLHPAGCFGGKNVILVFEGLNP